MFLSIEEANGKLVAAEFPQYDIIGPARHAWWPFNEYWFNARHKYIILHMKHNQQNALHNILEIHTRVKNISGWPQILFLSLPSIGDRKYISVYFVDKVEQKDAMPGQKSVENWCFLF